MIGPYVHSIDPIIGTILGIHLWWYGLSYTLGFFNAHRFIAKRRSEINLTGRDIFDLSLLLTIGVLVGGRFVEVVFYEWPFYREHIKLIPAFWLGGMATHGLMLGGILGIAGFSWRKRKRFLELTDALALPAAFILGVGRIGNFVDGQIIGSITSVPWAVRFPDADGFRHPVVLYDGAKNLLIIPLLWYLLQRRPATGVITGVFLFLYAFLRVFIDLLREYPTSLFGLATGQVLNIAMAIVGLLLIVLPLVRQSFPSQAGQEHTAGEKSAETGGLALRRIVLASLLLFSLIIPSDWTQDIPARYGKRHDGLVYNALYPRLDTTP